jgi:hypothetical protein
VLSNEIAAIAADLYNVRTVGHIVGELLAGRYSPSSGQGSFASECAAGSSHTPLPPIKKTHGTDTQREDFRVFINNDNRQLPCQTQLQAANFVGLMVACGKEQEYARELVKMHHTKEHLVGYVIGQIFDDFCVREISKLPGRTPFLSIMPYQKLAECLIYQCDQEYQRRGPQINKRSGELVMVTEAVIRFQMQNYFTQANNRINKRTKKKPKLNDVHVADLPSAVADTEPTFEDTSAAFEDTSSAAESPDSWASRSPGVSPVHDPGQPRLTRSAAKKKAAEKKQAKKDRNDQAVTRQLLFPPPLSPLSPLSPPLGYGFTSNPAQEDPQAFVNQILLAAEDAEDRARQEEVAASTSVTEESHAAEAAAARIPLFPPFLSANAPFVSGEHAISVTAEAAAAETDQTSAVVANAAEATAAADTDQTSAVVANAAEAAAAETQVLSATATVIEPQQKKKKKRKAASSAQKKKSRKKASSQASGSSQAPPKKRKLSDQVVAPSQDSGLGLPPSQDLILQPMFVPDTLSELLGYTFLPVPNSDQDQDLSRMLDESVVADDLAEAVTPADADALTEGAQSAQVVASLKKMVDGLTFKPATKETSKEA